MKPRTLPTLAVIAAFCIAALGMEAGGPAPVAAEPVAEVVSALPAFQRVEVTEATERIVPFTIRMARPGLFLGADPSCKCISLAEAPPKDLPAGDTVLPVRVTGILPGMKTLVVRTSEGNAQVGIHVVTPGLGDGSVILAGLAKRAQERKQRLVVIVHDLRGTVRNCGCSGGSLGGIDHLAALPAAFTAQGVTDARFVLSGDVDGEEPGVGEALATYGWEVRPTDVATGVEPLAAATRPGTTAVIPTGQVAISHPRIVKTLLDSGMVASVLLLDAKGQPTGQQFLPIDRTLPADAAPIARFPGKATIAIDQRATPSQSCAGCHAAAHATWAASAHARAFASLTPVDRVDACVTCHSTGLPATTTRAPHVGCTSCHQQTEKHAASAGTVRTEGTVECRSCHDAQHHPGFDREAAWERIRH